MRWPDRAIVAVIGIWLLLIIAANPVGEFPLDDDWSYSRAVRTLVENGRLEFTGFTAMPLITQVLWGALFCLPAGFSFTAVRLSTIALGLVGLLATYRLFRAASIDRAPALLGVIVLAVNPLYFALSATFMTDVPFFALSMLAMSFLLRGLRTERPGDFIAGYAFCLGAILIRQLAVVIPGAFLVAYSVKHGLRARVVRNALLPSVACVGVLLVYPAVLRRTIGLPALYDRAFEPIAESVTTRFAVPAVLADRLLVEWIYLGLFALPFSLALARPTPMVAPARGRLLTLGLGAGLVATILGFLLWRDRRMPLIGNILIDFGLGPTLLRDTYLLDLPHWPTAPSAFWLVVTAAAVLGAVLLAQHVARAVGGVMRAPGLSPAEALVERTTCLFLVIAAALYCGLIGITGFLDRYLIWVLPLWMWIAVAPGGSVRLSARGALRTAAAALILVYGFVAVAGTHDYLAWNRARWRALRDLTERDRIPYTAIDGGFEFNGWYAYDVAYRSRPSRSWWWVDDDEYLVAFGPVPGYVELRRYPFDRWLTPGRGEIGVLRRVEAPARTP